MYGLSVLVQRRERGLQRLCVVEGCRARVWLCGDQPRLESYRPFSVEFCTLLLLQCLCLQILKSACSVLSSLSGLEPGNSVFFRGASVYLYCPLL